MRTIEVENLSFRYPSAKGDTIREIDFSVEQGEVFGFLGPSGAGKSTLQKILTGTLREYRGSVRVFGIEMKRRRSDYYQHIGVDFEFPNFYGKFTARENLRYFASLYAGETADPMALLERVGLHRDADKRVDSFSKGMKMRLGFVRALLHDPALLFLDEPTSGLDPESAQNVNRMIRELAREDGSTVFLCTHQLRYAQEICTRYGLIEAGRLLAEGTLEELRAQVGSGAALRIRAEKMPEGLAFRQTGPGLYEKRIASDREIPGIVRQIVSGGGEIYAVEAVKPDLEALYFALTAKGKEDAQ